MICEALLALQTTIGASAPNLKTSQASVDAREAWTSRQTNVESLEGAKLYPEFKPAAARPPVVRVAENIPGSCAIQAKAYEQCANPWPAEADDPEGPALAESPADRVAQLKSFVKQFNSASAKVARCVRISTSARDECAGSPIMERANAIGGARTVRLQTWQGDLMERMNKIAQPQDAPYGLNCLLTPRDGTSVLKCFALDPTRPHTRAVTEADADVLDLTVGISGNCTFTVMPDGRLLTADHCGPRSLSSALIMRQKGSELITADLLGTLKASVVQLFTGSSFEDLAVWKGTGVTKGRSFYVLTQDPSLDSGCSVVDDLYVVCAPVEYQSLAGRRGTVVGFPMTRYKRRLEIETVIQSRGDIFFDQSINRIVVHAAINVGTSGGPVYLSAGAKIGGIKLDRPLFLGPVTNVNRWFREVKGEFATDSLVTVGIYNYAHVRSVMPPAGPGEGISSALRHLDQ